MSESHPIVPLLVSPGPALRAKRLDGIPCRLRPNSLSSMSAIYLSLSPSVISEANKPLRLTVSAYPKSQPNDALRALLLCGRSRLFVIDDELTRVLHELTQSRDQARQAGSSDHYWEQPCVSLGKTGAPRPHVLSPAKEMSCSPKAPSTECHCNLRSQQPGLRFEKVPRPGLQSHQKTLAASTRPQ